jgi:hypothetical protein
VPREIEDALLEQPDVLQAAVFAIPHDSLGEDVAAAVVLRQGNTATEASLREHLVSRLAHFKMPAQLLIVDKIPTAPTGKIQRSALPEIFAALLQTPFVAPQGALEQIIANIYAQVLSVPQVSVCENFFAMGGDSLRATQVVSRIRFMLSVNLTIAAVFSHSTVRQLASVVARLMESRDGGLVEVLLPSPADTPQGDIQLPRVRQHGQRRSN